MMAEEFGESNPGSTSEDFATSGIGVESEKVGILNFRHCMVNSQLVKVADPWQ